MWHRLKIVIVFALAGPLIGGWLACPLIVCAAELTSGDGFLSRLPQILGFCAIFAPFGGFVVGLVPAVVTGLILAWRLPRVATMRQAATTGFLATLAVLGGGFVFVLAREGTAGSGSILLAASLISSAIASAVCWRLIQAMAANVGRRGNVPAK